MRRDDNFFALGGDSLRAAQMLTTVEELFATAVDLGEFVAAPTVAGLATAVERGRLAADAVPVAERALRVARDAPEDELGEHPLSFQQQQLLTFDALFADSVVYNTALAVRVRGLREDVFQRALTEVHRRHGVLRTVLRWEGGSATQIVLPAPEAVPAIEVVDVPTVAARAELERLLVEYGRRAFDLRRQLPLRTTIFRLSDSEYVLLFQPHHIAFDAHAAEVLLREVGELYRAELERRPPNLPELRAQYTDFARWQRDRLDGAHLRELLNFWRSLLAGAPTTLRLPTTHPRPELQSFDGASWRRHLDADTAAQIRERCAAEQVTAYMLLLAVFATVLYRQTGQDDILIGGPMANRRRPEFNDLIGFFANTVVIRVRLGGNPTFSELLRRVRDSVLASYEHQETPLELVLRATGKRRDPAINPLFQVNFRVRTGPPPALALDDAPAAAVPVDLGVARFDLALALRLLDDDVEEEWTWNTGLYEQEMIDRLATTFESTLARCLAHPSTRLLDLEFGHEIGVTHEPTAASQGSSIRGFRGRERTAASAASLHDAR